MGPIFSVNTANKDEQASSNHIFFLAGHSEFDMDTYEYHEAEDSIVLGFVFALFSLKNASAADITSALMNT